MWKARISRFDNFLIGRFCNFLGVLVGSRPHGESGFGFSSAWATGVKINTVAYCFNSLRKRHCFTNTERLNVNIGSITIEPLFEAHRTRVQLLEDLSPNGESAKSKMHNYFQLCTLNSALSLTKAFFYLLVS